MSNLTSAFNDHFTQFLNDILIIFPEEKDIKIVEERIKNYE